VFVLGSQRSVVTNRAGNFYFEGRESELAMPYSVAMRYDTERGELMPQMFERPSYGGCARCHSASAVSTGGFEANPPSELVIAQPAVFTPGLYPNPE
jgi:hypothetical protein